jgi:hypothetical protein
MNVLERYRWLMRGRVGAMMWVDCDVGVLMARTRGPILQWQATVQQVGFAMCTTHPAAPEQACSCCTYVQAGIPTDSTEQLPAMKPAWSL